MLKRGHGQATLEYLIVIIFSLMIGIKIIEGLQFFIGSTMGRLAFQLTVKLTSGVCKKNCFYEVFDNGYRDTLNPEDSTARE